MQPFKYIAATVIFFVAFAGYNVFLVARDNKLFDAYYGKTRHQQACEQMKQWHPDCNLE